MALLFGELRGAHDLGCLGHEASIQHRCNFSLTQVDADYHLTNVGYICNSVSQFMGLVSVEGIAESNAFIGFVRGGYFMLDLAPL